MTNFSISDIKQDLRHIYTVEGTNVDGFPSFIGNRKRNSQLTERQTSEEFRSRRRSCRSTNRQCRQRQNNAISRVFEEEDESNMYPSKKREELETLYGPKGNDEKLRKTQITLEIIFYYVEHSHI